MIHRTVAVSAMLFLVAEIAVVAVGTVRPTRAQAAQAPPGAGFNVTVGDLSFILKQINIAEHHAGVQTVRPSPTHPAPSNVCEGLVGPGPNQVPDRLTPYGLRTVGGECNNLFPAGSVGNRPFFAASDQLFPRLAGPVFRDADVVPGTIPLNQLAPGTPAPPNRTSYKQKKGDVVDSQPRVISNLVVDQTSDNPAAIAAAGLPVRSQDPSPSAEPCAPGGDPSPSDSDGTPNGCTMAHKTLFIPNVTTDVGLSPPFNSVFTFFGQFFDHGVDQTVKSGSTVLVPLQEDDPLILRGPDGVAGTGDEVNPATDPAFMALTRAKNQPGPDGILGDRSPTNTGTPVPCTSLNVPDGCDESADDIQDATNTDTPLVDQSQTYTSHASHQAFLREYDLVAGKPVDTGMLLGDPDNTHPDLLPGDRVDSGMSTWASVKKQAALKLGLLLDDRDSLNIPMLVVDQYGNFVPGPARGLPMYRTPGPDGKLGDNPATTCQTPPGPANPNGVPAGCDEGLDDNVEGNIAAPVAVPTDVVHFDTPFLTDIAHNADPSPSPGSSTFKQPDLDTDVNDVNVPRPTGRYDDELLATHFTAGDGRVNENIALTAVHQIFHSEHDRLVAYVDAKLHTAEAADQLSGWTTTNADHPWTYGQRLFQAARFVTEMEYQHLVFEDFARKIAPAIRPFHIYHSDGNPVIPAEFAHAVYRFGHSMLDDDVARTNVDPDTGAKSPNSLKLLTAFLNPPEYFRSHIATRPTLTPEEAAGSIFMGSADQTGNEIDEFVTETLRNNLLGLPLDLPTINMTRAREAGVPPLNQLRKSIFADTNDSQLKPYTDWSDYGQHLKHPESLINYVAAYGTHPSILDADGYVAKREAARAIVDPLTTDTPPGDAADFMFSTGPWAPEANGHQTTGLDEVDLWVGGLGEVTNLFGGLLGTTFNYVFQTTLEGLQENDRFYYLNRTPGMNLRTQLEGNSFSELVLRNTQGTDTFKADAFGTADCKFKLSRLTFPFSGAPSTPPDPPRITGAGSVNDDPESECDENQLLLRKPDGTFQYRTRNSQDPPGINGQAVYQGSDSVVDRVLGGNDNDTLWGAGGKDILDGQGGDDVTFGGDDDDIITDLDGADIPEGGAGDDAIDAGPGDDIVIAGDGNDFTNGGSNDNETFAGEGDDYIIAGSGADAIFGDGGSDWVEGGSGQDLLQGDHAAPFFDDPGEGHPGHEIMIGQDGENDYDVEGGDDIMSQNAHVDRNAGAAGFDWAFHQFDTVGADDDMSINNFLDNVPLPVVVNRDRWQETEANSGSPFNDIIKGDDDAPKDVGGGGFSGCDALDAAGIARITGLNQLIPGPLPTPLGPVAQLSVNGTCPLTGPNVWAEGNILLGGGGGDTIEGRGADDIIDGDRALHVRITAPSVANPGQTLSTDLMEGKPKNPDGSLVTNGTFGPAGSSMSLQQAVFAGHVDPGDLRMIREIVTEPTTPGTIDTAVFSGPRADYDITPNLNATLMTVAHARGTATDGTDTLRGIERLRFADGDVTIVPFATLTPNPLAFGNQQVNTTSGARQATVTNSGNQPLAIPLQTATPAGFAITGPNAADFAITARSCGPTLNANLSCTVSITFRPTTTAAESATLTATNNSGGAAGATQTIALTGTGTVAPPQTPATGVPTVTSSLGIPLPLANLTANTGNIADVNGVGAFTFQWQQTAANGTAWSNITTGGTAQTFRIPLAGSACRSFRVQVSFTDGLNHPEGPLTSAPTPRVGGGLCAQPAPTTLTAPPSTTPLGQATAPRLALPSLSTRTLRVSATASGPLSVTASVPAGANTVAITLFRLNSVAKRTSASRKAPSSVHIATVYRKTTKAKRYVFRLTEKPFRHLKPGRYLVQVRVGTSRTALGPVASREITKKMSRPQSPLLPPRPVARVAAPRVPTGDRSEAAVSPAAATQIQGRCGSEAVAEPGGRFAVSGPWTAPASCGRARPHTARQGPVPHASPRALRRGRAAPRAGSCTLDGADRSPRPDDHFHGRVQRICRSTDHAVRRQTGSWSGNGPRGSSTDRATP